jgi:glucose-1-phosphate thymidylyltransferase
MRAIIPVAGIGSRLKPHTNTIPKVLLTVGDKPILGHILQKLLDSGIKEATFVTGHLGGMIKQYVEKNYPEMDSIFVEQKKQEGLGHAIYQAAHTFGNDEIFIILGDTIFDVDLDAVIALGANALGLKYVDDPKRFGVAIIENGKIKQLVEKPEVPPSNMAIVGLYYIKNSQKLAECLRSNIENNRRTRGEFQLTDALQMMLDQGEEMVPFTVDGWYDCGKPETLLETNRFLLSKHHDSNGSGKVVINPPCYIHSSALIENSVVGPFVTVSEGVKITDSVVKNSIIGPHAEVVRCIFEDSLIGANSFLRGKFTRVNTGDSSEIDFN